MEYFAKLGCVLVCASVLLVLQGCDWVKGQMGMPTSEDIAMMKEELQRKENERLEAERAKAVQDSLLLAAAQAQEAVEGYHVIVGCFRQYENADALVEKLKGMGCTPQKIELKIGYMMVSLGKHETLQGALSQMHKIWVRDDCPLDVWVYDARQNLHEQN